MKQPFNIFQLPLQGIQLIEASAGTGKTYSMTQIYLRLLLQKRLSVEQILVMSFTQAATAEIKTRIEQALNHIFQHWGDENESDPFFGWLYQQMETNEAKKIIRQALLSLDIAPIQTIHSFCHRILHHYALQTDQELESNLNELYLQAVRDYYRRHRHSDLAQYWPSPEKFYEQLGELLKQDRDYRVLSLQQLQDQAGQIKQDILAHRAEIEERLIHQHRLARQRAAEWQPITDWLAADRLLPLPEALKIFFDKRRRPRKAPLSTGLEQIFARVSELLSEQKNILAQQERYQLAAQAITEIRELIQQEKQKQKRMDFDDLIHRVRRILMINKYLAQQLFQQHPAALIDEFQDTDQQQLNIIKQLYMQGERRQQASLYMIGDPKQSIYAFRGGDIFAYLEAKDQVDRIWSMSTNWRSSPDLVAAYNHLFQQSADCFGEGIDYYPVTAAKALPPIQDPEGQQSLVFMHYEPEADEKENQIKAQVAQACANEINRLLKQRIKLGKQIIQPRDIVILVRNRGEAQYIENSLKQAGLSAVYLSQRERLFQSPQAKQLLTALKGILYPEDESLFRAALTTPYLGSDLQLIAGLNHNIALWEEWYGRLQELRKTWHDKGFMSMAMSLLHRYYQPLADENLERSLTNSLHLIEVLQEYSRRHHAQPMQLMRWFTEQIYYDRSELELRLESEENLLRIQTQHGSKGLQYPIVFIPFAAFEYSAKKGQEVFPFHDENKRLVYQLGPLKSVISKVEQEALWENNRLFYVAVTRAIHRCYIYTTSLKKQRLSPISQVLNQSDILSALQKLVKKQPNAIALRTSILPYHAPFAPPSQNNSQIKAAQLRPQFSIKPYRIKSFSSLVWHRGGIGLPDRDQEDQAEIKEDQGQLRFCLRSGMATGHLLHEIMEQLDFKQPEWQKAIQAPLARYGRLPTGFKPQDLIQWLQEVIHTPLPDFCLADIPKEKTLREVEFYYATQDQNIQKLLQQYGLSIQNLSLGHMMQGYIDLIFEHQGRYYIADYKSNYLGADYNAYQTQYLEQNIRDYHYDIQALIYAIALHRHLQSRLANYQPEYHFGGVYYFYLRGMHPNQKTGVYFQKISPEFLQAWNQVFEPH